VDDVGRMSLGRGRATRDVGTDIDRTRVDDARAEARGTV